MGVVKSDEEHLYLGDPDFVYCHGDAKDERPCYATRCTLPDGSIGVFSQIIVKRPEELFVLWVH